jgi:photosystem II stability/assembly factor-like uncharacterized protein
MNDLSKSLKHWFSILIMFTFADPISAQSWIELREQAANFYTIQAAFNREYGKKSKEMTRELHREFTKKRRKNDKFERQMEGMIQYQRWAHFVEPRVIESNGDISAIGTNISRALADQSRSTIARSGANWTLVGPKNTPANGGNGRINTVRPHPSVSGTLFACAPAGGLWKTTNNGESWTAISDEIAILGATDLAFDPINPNIMYLATGDGEGSTVASTGVYKSTNGGISWSATGLIFTVDSRKNLSKLLVNPTDGSIIVGGSAGIFRSTNGGTSWTQTSTLSVHDLEFNPSNPSIIYAGGYVSSNPLLRSTNGGVTWTATGTGLPISDWLRVAIAVTPLDDSYVYAFVANSNNGFQGLYLSTDGGLSFTLKSTAPNILGWQANGSDLGGQGFYTLSITVDPSVKTTIYTGGVNMWQSTNSGASWRCIGHWANEGAPYIHADIHDLIFSGSTLYVANDGGVFTFNSTNQSWIDRSSNLAIAQIYGFGISQNDPNLIVSGHQDNGTNLTKNGTSWTQVGGADGMQCFIDHANDNRIYSSIYNGYLSRSTNGGASFSPIFTVPNGGWVTPWLQDPISAETLYAGGVRVFKSTDGGTNWASIMTTPMGKIVALDVANSNTQNIVAASANQVMKTSNNGANWADITANLPTNAAIQTVYFDPTDARKMYVGLASYLGKSVYFSDNDGVSWTNISAGLPNVPVNCFVAQKSNGDLYCGTDIGVYLWSPSSARWTPFTTGMPGIEVVDLDIYAPTNKLRAATYARGIWESPVNSTTRRPTVNITSPLDNFFIPIGTNVTINATATAIDGTLTKVEFYRDTTLLNTSTTPPFSYIWTNPPVGNYPLIAKAYDNNNAIGVSQPINISIKVPNDAGISMITGFNDRVNVPNITPSVILKNYGINTLSNTIISYKIDNNPWIDFAWTGSITAGATSTINLPTISGFSIGNHTLTVKSGLVNGNPDGNTTNDISVKNVNYSLSSFCTNTKISPYGESFEGFLSGWATQGWSRGLNHGTGSTYGFYINMYQAVSNAQFTTAPVGLINATDNLSFDYRLLRWISPQLYPASAYPVSRRWGSIEILVSTDCGQTFTSFYTINDSTHVFDKNWATKKLPLSNYTNQTLVFRFLVKWTGQDWYVDFDNFFVATDCSNAPTAATIHSGATTVCAGSAVVFYSNVAAVNSNIAYQWQKSTDNGRNWSDLIGANAATTSVQITNSTQYRLALTCKSNNETAVSNTVSINVISNDIAQVPYVQDFELWTTSPCVNGQTTQDIPTNSWTNTPIKGNGSWRREDEGATAQWNNSQGAYSPNAKIGAHSARFHSTNTSASGQLDLYIDLSGPANKNVSFYYINTDGEDSLRVLLSTDLGLTFKKIGATLKTAATWSLLTFTLPNATNTSIIRLEAFGNFSISDIGVDYLSVTEITAAPTACPTPIAPAQNAQSVCPINPNLLWNSVKNASSYDIFTNIPSLPSPVNVVDTFYTIPIQLLENANYTWKVVPKNSLGTPIGCAEWSFKTSSGACYCLPIYAEGCANGFDLITRVRLGNLDNNTGTTCGFNSFTFYDTVNVPNLTQAASYFLTLNLGNDADQYVGAWIDYDQNGFFDKSEYIGGNSTTPIRSNGIFVINFEVPDRVITGRTRLRIRGGDDLPISNAQACGETSSAYGQGQDYRVNIVPMVIPVELTSINAFAQNDVNKIEWTTASEKEVDAFIIERSEDIANWISIGSLSPKGGKNRAFYSLIDSNPLILSYYRLKTLDLNGQVNLSKIVSVSRFNKRKLTVLSVAPVPTTEGITIDFSIHKSALITIKLTNIMGQLIKEIPFNAIEGMNKMQLNLYDVPIGAYLLNISDNNTSELKRIIKQ